MIELQKLINKWKQEADDIDSKHREMFNPYHPLTAEFRRLRKCINEAQLLLKHDESKQPQPPDFANTMLGEVPHVVNDRTEEISQAVEGATPVVRQNEQIQKVCFRISCFFQRNGLCKHVRDVYEKCGWKQTE